MAIETLEDSIAAWDQGRENTLYEDTTVTTSAYTTSCPQAPDITINNTTLAIADGEGYVITEEFNGLTGTEVALAHQVLAGFSEILWKNNVVQINGTDYSLNAADPTVITMAEALVATDTIKFRYAYEVVV